jgi:hypothetical protein
LLDAVQFWTSRLWFGKALRLMSNAIDYDTAHTNMTRTTCTVPMQTKQTRLVSGRHQVWFSTRGDCRFRSVFRGMMDRCTVRSLFLWMWYT